MHCRVGCVLPATPAEDTAVVQQDCGGVVTAINLLGGHLCPGPVGRIPELRSVDGLAVYLHDHVAGLDPYLGRGAVGVD